MATATRNVCHQCGDRFARLTKDGKRATGSVDMIWLDPDELFCTLRCAARYGVKALQAKLKA